MALTPIKWLTDFSEEGELVMEIKLYWTLLIVNQCLQITSLRKRMTRGEKRGRLSGEFTIKKGDNYLHPLR